MLFHFLLSMLSLEIIQTMASSKPLLSTHAPAYQLSIEDLQKRWDQCPEGCLFKKQQQRQKKLKNIYFFASDGWLLVGFANNMALAWILNDNDFRAKSSKVYNRRLRSISLAHFVFGSTLVVMGICFLPSQAAMRLFIKNTKSSSPLQNIEIGSYISRLKIPVVVLSGHF